MSLLSEASDSICDLNNSAHEILDSSLHSFYGRSIHSEADSKDEAEQASRQSLTSAPRKATKVDLHYVTQNIISMAAPWDSMQIDQGGISPIRKFEFDQAEEIDMQTGPSIDDGPLHERDTSITPTRPQSPSGESNQNQIESSKNRCESRNRDRDQLTEPQQRRQQGQEHQKKQSQTKSRGNCPIQISSFLDKHHHNHYLLFDISSKTPTPRINNLLNNQIVSMPWVCPGINPSNPLDATAPTVVSIPIPTLKSLLDICYAIDAYLRLDPQNIAVVYCSNGRVRTGIALAAYLKFSNSRSRSCGVSSSLEGFRLFCSRTCQNLVRNENLDYLIPPTLKTLFCNFDAMVECGGAIQRERLVLRAVTLQGLPVEDMPRVDIWDERGLVFSSHGGKSGGDRDSEDGNNNPNEQKEKTMKWADEDAYYRVNKIILGDFLLLCRFGGQYAHDTDDPTKVILRYRNNTSFLYPSPHELPKNKVDVMRKYADDVDESVFLMTFQFETPSGDDANDGGDWDDFPAVLEGIDALHRGWSLICERHAIGDGHEFNDGMENDLILLQKYYHGEVGVRTMPHSAPNLLLMTLAMQISNGDIDRAVNVYLEGVMKSMWKDLSKSNPFSISRIHQSITAELEFVGDIPQCLSAVEEVDSRDFHEDDSMEDSRSFTKSKKCFTVEDEPELGEESLQGDDGECMRSNDSFMNVLDAIEFSSDSDGGDDGNYKDAMMSSVGYDFQPFCEQVADPICGDVAEYLGYDDSSSSSSNSINPLESFVTSPTLGRRGNKRRSGLISNNRARKKVAKEHPKPNNTKRKSAVETLKDVAREVMGKRNQMNGKVVAKSDVSHAVGFDDRYRRAIMNVDATLTRRDVVSVRACSRSKSSSFDGSLHQRANNVTSNYGFVRTDSADTQTRAGFDKSRVQNGAKKQPIQDLGSLDAFTSRHLTSPGNCYGEGAADFGEKVKLVIGGNAYDDGRILSKDGNYYTVQIPANAFKDGKFYLDKAATGAAADTESTKSKDENSPGEEKANGTADAAAVIAKSKEEKPENRVNSDGDPLFKDDPEYVKYFKMLKMGLPIGAVKNAVVRDSKDPSMMDLDPNKSLKSQLQKDSGGGDDGPILKEDPEYEKFFKMLKMGLPIGAVKNALVRDGKDPSVMDLDPNKSVKSQLQSNPKGKEEDTGPALKDDPDYEKFFKMLKMGLPIGAVKNALVRDGKDPSVMDLDPNKSVKSQMKSDDEEEDKDTGTPLKDDPDYEKFFKMLKMGLPIGAVKNALVRDGKDPSIMDLDPNKSVKSQMKSDDEEEDKDTGTPLKDDPDYEKFFKMLKMGLPIGAVKNALVRDGKDPSIMDLDPNQSIEFQRREKAGSEAVDTGVPLKDDPEYEKFFKMVKMGLPVGAVQNALQRDGKDPSIMDLDPNLSVAFQLTKKKGGAAKTVKKEKKIKVRRKKIYWNALDKSKVKTDSLWGKIRGMVDMEKLKIDTSEFESLFTETLDPSQKKKKKASADSDAAKPKKSVQVIEGKRGMNGGIILARLKMDFLDLARIVDNM